MCDTVQIVEKWKLSFFGAARIVKLSIAKVTSIFIRQLDKFDVFLRRRTNIDDDGGVGARAQIQIYYFTGQGSLSLVF